MVLGKAVVHSATDIDFLTNNKTYQPHKTSHTYDMIIHEYFIEGDVVYVVYDKTAFGDKCRVYTDIDYKMMMRALMTKDRVSISDKEVKDA
jgi:hypothetical protein